MAFRTFLRLAKQPPIAALGLAAASCTNFAAPTPAACGWFGGAPKGPSVEEMQAALAKKEAELAAAQAKAMPKFSPLDKLKELKGGLPFEFSDVTNPEQLAALVGGKLNEVIETGYPSQVGFGFISGWCSGFALKKLGKLAAFGFGSLFVLLQGLAYSGYIDVNYGKLESDVSNVLDRNHDGKLDAADAKAAFDEIVEVVGFGMPAGGGFSAGLLAGLRQG